MSLAQRSVRSLSWTVFAGILGYPVGLIQSIILARLLSIETFGVFVGASSFVTLSYVVFDFGLSKAFIHRTDETQDEDRASFMLFTLRLLLDSIWAIVLIGCGLIFFSGERRIVFLVLTISGYLAKLTVAPRAVLIRRVQHRRLAILDLSIMLTSALLSMLIAWYTASIWALLISSITATVIGIGGLFIIKPFWKPKIAWEKSAVKYFFSFGGKNLINDLLNSGIENLDNIWTNYFLGDQLLGFYSRAFKFATYPRMLLAFPINVVLLGTFAELKFDRDRLSKAFFRSSVLLTRTGFLIAGGLTVIAPEFITIFLGEKWMPILAPFRLMLIFALLDPIRLTAGEVLVAIGRPEKVSRIRIIQFIVLVLGLFVLGLPLKVLGVALAIDLMSLGGTIISLAIIRNYVDFSLKRLLLPPLLSLGVGIGFSWLLNHFWMIEPMWISFLLKGSVFSIGYLVSLFVIEGKDLYQTFIRIVDLKALKNQMSSWSGRL